MGSNLISGDYLPPDGGVLEPPDQLSSVDFVSLRPSSFLFLPASGPTIAFNLSNNGQFPLNICIKSSFTIVFVGMLGVSFSKPPCIKILASAAQTVCLNLYNVENFFHSEDSVSYTSSCTFSPTLLVLPPRTIMKVPTNMVECQYLASGSSVFGLYGALTQSHLPSLCLLNPHVSFNALWSAVLPPNITIIPVALPV